jgi:hypothetical protein
MRLIAKSRVYYPSGGGVEYQPGDTFETETDKDAEALVLVGMAEYPAKSAPAKKLVMPAAAPAATVVEPKPDVIETKEMRATDTDANDPLTAPRAYRRRDMRPE